MRPVLLPASAPIPNEVMQQSLRRKSCLACVQGKRRCDLRLPRCRRCERAGRDCLYPKAHPGVALCSPDEGGCLSNQSRDVVYSAETRPSTAWQSVPLAQTSCNDNLLDLPIFAHDDQWMDSVANPLSTEVLPPVHNVAEVPVTSTTTTAAATNTNTDLVGDVATVCARLQPRMEYAARRIAAQTLLLAETGRCTFIHHAQVPESGALRDAFSASAAHAMGSSANASLVRSEISRRAAALVDAVGSAGAVSRWPLVEMDMLPPVQALLIYQVIRLFSPHCGITERAQAERDAVVLRSWVTKLRATLKPIHSNHDTSSSSSSSSSMGTTPWESWVGEESTRRTIVFAETLRGVCSFLKREWDGASECVHNLEYTAQVGLWEAQSAAEWRTAVSRLPALPVNMKSYHRDLLESTPSDVDDLTIILYGASEGLDSLEEWLDGDRQLLEKWGLRGNASRYSIY